MEFGLLGPLTVVEGGSDVTPARPKQRALLALLLLRRGELVPGAQLIEALWGEEPPGTAQTALHGHISALRKLVGPERIRTRPPGYLLDVSAGEVDLGRFEALVTQARERDDPAARSSCLREALALAAFEQSLELWRELGDEAGVTRALVGIAQVLVAMGETERAEAISLDLLARAAGDARTEHYAYHFLADCALIRGDPEEARTRYRHSLRAALALGDVLETGWEVQGVAMSEAGAGNPRRAVVLAGSVEALWESLGLASPIAFWDALLERYLAPARASLGDECDAVLAEGRALACDAAVELALNDNAELATAR